MVKDLTIIQIFIVLYSLAILTCQGLWRSQWNCWVLQLKCELACFEMKRAGDASQSWCFRLSANSTRKWINCIWAQLCGWCISLFTNTKKLQNKNKNGEIRKLEENLSILYIFLEKWQLCGKLVVNWRIFLLLNCFHFIHRNLYSFDGWIFLLQVVSLKCRKLRTATKVFPWSSNLCFLASYPDFLKQYHCWPGTF